MHLGEKELVYGVEEDVPEHGNGIQWTEEGFFLEQEEGCLCLQGSWG